MSEAVTYGAPARHGQNQSVQAKPQAQAAEQTEDEDFATLYTRTVANIRNAMLGEESVPRPGAGHLIRNPDPAAMQEIDLGRFAENEFIGCHMVRGVFRRSDTCLLGFLVQNEAGTSRVLYTFTQQGNDMIPGNLYRGVRRARFGWGIQYRSLEDVTVSRRRLREAVSEIYHHDPNTSTHTMEDSVQTLAVALAEGSRFQAIPAQIAQAIRGGTSWTVHNHADEIRTWDQRSGAVLQARATDPTGNGQVWQQRRRYPWNGNQVLFTALDLARRLYLIKPPARKG
ncbi:ribosome-inactivating family protein [Streptomyces sp. NPDC090442]|uniref:ribosome-inactivating family protein n=1 Tax=Streptomyces sp. NPDC090442 TaxID=3365962 RepID=UPI0037F7C10D